MGVDLNSRVVNTSQWEAAPDGAIRGNDPEGLTGTTQLEAPTLFNGTVGDGEVALSWSAVAGATAYQLEVDGDVTTLGNTTSHTVDGLTNGESYEFRIRAMQDEITGDWTSSLFREPRAPGNLPLPTPDEFQADLETGDFSQSNPAGFNWYSNVAFSVVRDDNTVTANSSGLFDEPKGPFDGKQWESNPITGGSHAMRARYAAGREQTEIRFHMGSTVLDDVWFRWMLKVPINFVHTDEHLNNNKLCMFWMDDYSADGDGSTCGMEFRPNNNGGSNFYCKVSEGGGTLLGGDQGSTHFISSPADQGRWMVLAVHLVCESSPGASDGVMEVYRAWADEDNFTQTHHVTGQPIHKPDSGAQGFNRGYLMGYANEHYNEETEFLLDDFCISSASNPLV